MSVTRTRLLRNRTTWLFLAPLVLSLALGAAFWSPANLRNLIAVVAIEGIMCIGMTIVMVAGGFDLSIGSVMALAGVVVMGAEPMGLTVAVALALGAAALTGLANGLLVGVLRINPFIATLATMIIVRALVLTATASEPVSGTDLSLMEMTRGTVAGVPVVGIVLVVLAALGHALMMFWPFGRDIHALGGNEAAARASGIETVRLKIACYTLCSLCAGIAGVLLAGRLNTGSPIIGEQAALNVITAVLLGGTSMSGGVGTIWGSVAGLFCIGVLESVTRILDVPAYWQRVLQGGLLLSIVAADRLAANKPVRWLRLPGRDTGDKGRPS